MALAWHLHWQSAPGTTACLLFCTARRRLRARAYDSWQPGGTSGQGTARCARQVGPIACILAVLALARPSKPRSADALLHDGQQVAWQHIAIGSKGNEGLVDLSPLESAGGMSMHACSAWIGGVPPDPASCMHCCATRSSFNRASLGGQLPHADGSRD